MHGFEKLRAEFSPDGTHLQSAPGAQHPRLGKVDGGDCRVKKTLNSTGPTGNGCFREFQEAQARSGEDFGGKWKIPATPTAAPLAIFNPPAFSRGLQEL
jgi:hypothetical protein